MLTFLIFLSLFSLPTQADDKIFIGHFSAMTGAEAAFGAAEEKGLKMAIEEINSTGGVKGKKLALMTADDQGKAEEAVTAVKRLVTQNKVIALIGEVASTRSLAAAPIAQQYKVPMISPSSTNPKVTGIGDYIFRVCFIDPFQGTVMAKFARENLKVKRVAILRDLKSDYSVGLADFFAKKFKELGGEVVADVSYQSGDVAFEGALTRIKGYKPEALFVPGYYADVGLIARQSRNLALKAVLLGGDSWDSDKLIEIGGDAVDGSYYSSHYSTDRTDPLVVEFIKKFRAKYGVRPDALSALAYDAIKILAQAMENTKDLSPSSVRDELAETKNFKGVTGLITIDHERNANKSAVIVKVHGKNRNYVTTLNP